ncbi:phosphoenolpyruvate carboxykinase (ATP) [Singulisphaera rosea]
MELSSDRPPAQDQGRSAPKEIGLDGPQPRHRNVPPAMLTEHALRRGEGVLSNRGAFVFQTGKYTGRSPKDKFVVREPSSEASIDWGEVNQPFNPERFDGLLERVLEYLRGREVWIEDLFAGNDPAHRLPIRVVCERASHALFAHQLFVRPTTEERSGHLPEFTIVAAPGFQAIPGRDGTRTEVFILVDFARKIVLIGGTEYAGEIKKSVFTILNYLLPMRGVLSMHCSANVGEGGDVALFFGLSGTGKTTLSADPRRSLIGDDEHGWGDDGVFNIEGGCYAKCIRLDRRDEPEIFDALRFGSVLENVVIDETTRVPDFLDATLTENTRAAYPIDYIPNHVPGGRGPHPRRIIFLTCDAFGVLPPVARLNLDQALYHFLSGYTAKVAGTERGLGVEPSAVFSTCFGAPFMTLPPSRYADLLGTKMRQHQVSAWLLNTGWTGGGFGQGRRIALSSTRALVDAIMSGALDHTPGIIDPIFGFESPTTCPGVPAEILNPRSAWPDPKAYDAEAARLALRFRENFRRFHNVGPGVHAAGPRIV